MTVTLATPPAGPNEQIYAVDVSLWCDGVDPVLGVPRPPQSSPETFTINTSTSQGPEPKNTIGLLEKQGRDQPLTRWGWTPDPCAGWSARSARDPASARR